MHEAQGALIYSEADFEPFCPAGRHVAAMGVKFGTEEGTDSMPNFTPISATVRTPKAEIWHGGGAPPCQISPHRCNFSPLWGEKPQNRPMSNLNTAACAACNADLPKGRCWTWENIFISHYDIICHHSSCLLLLQVTYIYMTLTLHAQCKKTSYCILGHTLVKC